jgi:hypothetical protein
MSLRDAVKCCHQTNSRNTHCSFGFKRPTICGIGSNVMQRIALFIRVK